MKASISSKWVAFFFKKKTFKNWLQKLKPRTPPHRKTRTNGGAGPAPLPLLHSYVDTKAAASGLYGVSALLVRHPPPAWRGSGTWTRCGMTAAS